MGTKGYCYKGLDEYEHFEKIRDRELKRLEMSFEAASLAGVNFGGVNSVFSVSFSDCGGIFHFQVQ